MARINVINPPTTPPPQGVLRDPTNAATSSTGEDTATSDTSTNLSGPTNCLGWAVELDEVVGRRRTNRLPFLDDEVADFLIHRLVRTASIEGAHLFAVPAGRVEAIKSLVVKAQERRDEDRAYRAGVGSYSSRGRGIRRDGQAASGARIGDRTGLFLPPLLPQRQVSRPAVHPSIGGAITRLSGPPAHGPADQPIAGVADGPGRWLILGTDGDEPGAWLRTGEALEAALLAATRHGLSARLLTTVIEIPETRAALRREFHLPWLPHLVLRIGHAPLTPAARRRPLVDMLKDTS